MSLEDEIKIAKELMSKGIIAASKYLVYIPISVGEILIKMRDLAELMVDLAYASIIYGDVDLASEVKVLEEKVDWLVLQLLVHASLATRDAEDAISMTSIFILASSMDRISDAAADIADVVLRIFKAREIVGKAVLKSDEVISMIKIDGESRLIGRSIRDVIEKENIGFDVIALRKEAKGGYALSKWILGTEINADYKFERGDVVIVRGDIEAINKLRRLNNQKPISPKPILNPKLKEIVQKILDLKSLSELMVDLSLSTYLYRSKSLAKQVLILEDKVDKEYLALQRSVLDITDLSSDDKLALLRIASASEDIADAAAKIAETIIRDITPHAILRRVLEACDERIIIARATQRTPKIQFEELGLDELGARILALSREGKWFVNSSKIYKMCIKPNDILIMRCYEEAESKVKGRLSSLGFIFLE